MTDRERPLYLGVIRVSTQRQVDSGHGLDAQSDALHRWAHGRDVDLEVISVPGRTGKRRSPELRAVLDRLANHEADGLLCTKVDRLARSMLDAAEIMSDARREGWNLVITDLGVDLTTPSGQLVAHVLAAMAEFEHKLIAQRVSESLRAAQARGVRVGRPPGVPDEVVARVRRESHDGLNCSEIARGLTDDGVPTATGLDRWQPGTVRAVLLRTGGDPLARKGATA